MKKHHNGEKQKQVILSELAEILKAGKSVVFVYAYGSFVYWSIFLVRIGSSIGLQK